MAVAYDAATASTRVNAAGVTFSHTCTGSDRILLVGVHIDTDLGGTITGVTYAGVSMTQIYQADMTSPFGHTHAAFYLIAPATGANNVVVTCSTSMDGLSAGAISLTGAHQTVPLGTHAASSAVAASHDETVTSSASGMVVGFLATEIVDVINEQSGQTRRYTAVPAQTFIGYGSTKPGDTSVTMGWDSTVGTPRAGIGVIPIIASAASSASPAVLSALLRSLNN